MTAKKLKALPGAARILPPPTVDEGVKAALRRSGTQQRDEEGRIRRKTGRDVQFATIVTPEFHAWMKTEAKRRGKRMCVLLEDMRAAYVRVHGAVPR